MLRTIVSLPAPSRRGFDQLVGYTLEELVGEEDPERLGRARDDDAPVGVDPSKLGHDLELRDHENLHGDDKRAYDQYEEHAPSLEPQLGEGVSAHDVDGYREGHSHHGDDHGVQEPLEERQLLEDPREPGP